MTRSAEAVRKKVARALKVRRNRWWFFLAALLLEAAGLVTLGNGPVLLILLPIIAVPTLIPILLLGRYRLPDEEWEDSATFAGQAANLKGCFATHMYFRHRYSRDVGEDREVKIVNKKSSRGIRGKSKFLAMHAPGASLFVTPRSYWVQQGGNVQSGDITSLDVDIFSFTDKVRRPLDQDEVIGSTWFHATKRGEQDLRYSNNWELWEVRRYGVELTFGEYLWAFNLYTDADACVFANAFSAICKRGPALIHTDEKIIEDDIAKTLDEDLDEDEDDEEAPREWYDVLIVSPNASVAEIKTAYRNRISEYHPDRVTHLGDKLRLLADQEATAINHAYEEAMRQRR